MTADLTKGGDSRVTYWQERWVDKQTSWDQNGPHPFLPGLLEAARKFGGLKSSGSILEPGCGRAHNGAWLAQQGLQVTAFDAAPKALEEARKLYTDQDNLELTQGDALNVPRQWHGQFDGIFDRAMLCALQPELRDGYVQSIFACLKPGGVFMSLPFSRLDLTPKEGPPFSINVSDTEALFSPYATLAYLEERLKDVNGSFVKGELIMVWRQA